MAAVNCETGQEVAIKLALEQAQQTSAELREVVLQACLKHEYIVPILDILYDPIFPPLRGSRGTPQLGVVMEKIEGGDLFDKVVGAGGLSEDAARVCFRQIFQAMAYCHGRGVAHRDMKLENLILTRGQDCKVCDFGLAKNVAESAASTIIGTGKYVAPEVLAGTGYDAFKSDIWSCGVCLFCVTECAFPFTKAGNDGVGGEGKYRASASDTELMKYLREAK